MVIYNVTVKVDNAVYEEWLHWMKTVHIPDVMATGYFTGYTFLHLLGHDDEQGVSYTIQYRCNSLSDFEAYEANCALALRNEHTERYKNRFVAFRTLLEEV